MTEYTDALGRVKERIAKGRTSTDPRDAIAAEELNDVLTVALGEAPPKPANEPANNLNLSGSAGGPASSGSGNGQQ